MEILLGGVTVPAWELWLCDHLTDFSRTRNSLPNQHPLHIVDVARFHKSWMTQNATFMMNLLAWTFNIHASCPLHYRHSAAPLVNKKREALAPDVDLWNEWFLPASPLIQSAHAVQYGHSTLATTKNLNRPIPRPIFLRVFYCSRRHALETRQGKDYRTEIVQEEKPRRSKNTVLQGGALAMRILQQKFGTQIATADSRTCPLRNHIH
ncbi:hypothetical protein EDD18DRAFT_1108108 [Armillaria luteobubalina]|uniref:Uncharacterized protein n=1 Tax=Armillaria luteobubalina TaxID=153913 RepID=A0AA39PZI1_9AGAR|nr:hypothetical protein EDD18DRAFT_1108108 [Armillaria luteobubalina]